MWRGKERNREEGSGVVTRARTNRINIATWSLKAFVTGVPILIKKEGCLAGATGGGAETLACRSEKSSRGPCAILADDGRDRGV